MSHTTWMIYGATGATGTLIAEEAICRGHQPVLAGRSAETLASLGKRLGLPWMTVGLDEPGRLEQAVSEVDAVLNAAGPFIATAPPLVQACLAAGTHYLDIAGEIPVLQHLFARDQAARERNITLIGGVGFGVVASNGLAKYVADQLPGATTLELAVKADNQRTSQGATKSVLAALAGGGYVYRESRFVPFRLGKGLKALRFPDGTFDILPVPSGDLEAAYRATGIPNITAFLPFRRSAAFLLPFMQWGLSLRPIRGRLEAVVEKRGTRQRESQAGGQRTSYAWARAMNQNGQQVEAWLELGEGYHFTAASSVQAVEQVLRDHPSGALTPAQAFGADFVLNIEGVRRWLAPPLVHILQENRQ
ncbi:MAG: saccharopine dehydrogenase family protein [Ktedonobacteraceae bacterium]